ncbi:MAG: penicillin acylase family protein [Thermodesulfobacteriota bacterium]
MLNKSTYKENKNHNLRIPIHGLIRYALIVCLITFGITLRASNSLKTASAASGICKIINVGTDTAKICRDEFGIPHIFSPTDKALFHAFGYATAQDRLFQADMFIRLARGTLAEVFGADFLDSDIFIRTIGYTNDELEQMINELPLQNSMKMQAFADGYNQRVTEVMSDVSQIPLEFLILGPSPGIPLSPVNFTPKDMIRFAHIAQGGFYYERELDKSLLLFLLQQKNGGLKGGQIFEDLFFIDDPAAPTTVPKKETVSIIAKQRKGSIKNYPFGQTLKPLFKIEKIKSSWSEKGIHPPNFGSYGGVIAPKKTIEHKTTLFGGPQLNQQNPGAPVQSYEIQLSGGESGYNFIGFTIPLAPLIVSGHSDHHVLTDTTADGKDLTDIYIETVCDTGIDIPDITLPDGRTFETLPGTIFNGDCIPIEFRFETYEIAGSSPHQIIVIRTHHGPAVSDVASLPDGTLLIAAMQMSFWKQDAKIFPTFDGLIRSSDVDEFVSLMSDMVFPLNYLYGDKEGNIAYVQGGKSPIRAPCVPEKGCHPRLPLDGRGGSEWLRDSLTGSFVFASQPKSVNPSQGYLVTWNNKPWALNYSADNPAIGSFHWVEEMVRIIESQPKHSYHDVMGMIEEIGRTSIFTVEGGAANAFLPELLDTLEQSPPTHPSSAGAIAILEDWDQNALADPLPSTGSLQVGYIIFFTTIQSLLNKILGDELDMTGVPAAGGQQPFFTTTFLGTGVDPRYSWALKHIIDDALLKKGSTVPLKYDDYFNGRNPNDVISEAFDDAMNQLSTAFGTNDPNLWLAPRPQFPLTHPLLGILGTTPGSARTTWAQVTQLNDIVQSISINTLGESGDIRFGGFDADGNPIPAFDPHFSDQKPLYDNCQFKAMDLKQESDF